MENVVSIERANVAEAVDPVDPVQVYLKRLEEATIGPNKTFFKRMNSYCTMALAALEAGDILTEARETYKTLKATNKKISMSTHLRSVDNILVYIFLKNLMTAPSTTQAYKLGLIDKDGNLLREPKTKAEEDSISNLDLFIGKLRTWLRPHLTKLSKLSWIRSMDSSYRIQNALGNVDTLSKRAVVMRVNQELDKVLK